MLLLLLLISSIIMGVILSVFGFVYFSLLLCVYVAKTFCSTFGRNVEVLPEVA